MRIRSQAHYFRKAAGASIFCGRAIIFVFPSPYNPDHPTTTCFYSYFLYRPPHTESQQVFQEVSPIYLGWRWITRYGTVFLFGFNMWNEVFIIYTVVSYF